MMIRPSPRKRALRDASIFAPASTRLPWHAILVAVAAWLAFSVAGLGFAQDLDALRDAVQAEPTNVEAWIELGDALYEAGDVEGAKDAFLEAVAVDYRACDAHYGLGLAEFGRGDFQAALFAFNETTRLCADRFDGQFNRAVTLARLRRSADAAAAFRTAIEVAEPEATSSDLVNAYLGLAGQLESTGDNAGAAAAYGSALELDPTNTDFAFRRGRALYNAGQGLDALPDLVELEQTSDDYRVSALIADIYVDQGQVDYALRSLQRALTTAEADGDDAAQANILVELGLLQRELGRTAEAAGSFQRATDLEGATWEAFYNLGVSFLESGQTRSALDPLETAAERQPDVGAVQLALASAYDQLAMTDAALPAARRAVQLLADADQRVQAQFILGRALYRQGDYEAAARELEQVVAARPSDGQAQLWAGLSEYQLGNYRSAALYYERAVQLEPGSPEARINLGAAYLAAERYEDAEAVYGQLVTQNPDDAQSQYNLGWSLIGQQRRGAARDAWGSACDLGYTAACEALQRYF